MLNLDPTHYQLIKPLPWSEVFETWRHNEESNQAWIKFYQDKGFKTWEEWRRVYAEPLNCGQKQWFLYQVNEPLTVASQWRGGPLRTWRKLYYQGQDLATFQTIVTGATLQEHPGYQKMLSLYEDFPGKTNLTGLVTDQGIVIIEGMHRCCALALAALDNKTVSTEVEICLAAALGEELPLTGQEPSLNK